MNDRNGSALTRLRAADPAVVPPNSRDPHARDPYARAMLDRVLMAGDEPPAVRSAPARRRLAVGVSGAAAVVAASALAVTTPWSAGQPAAAYTVDKHKDGSVNVTIRLSQLKNPKELNAELARAGAHTVVIGMVPAEQCPGAPAVDLSFPMRTSGDAAERAARRAELPVTYVSRGGSVFIVIQPAKIPAGDTLVLGYSDIGATILYPMVVVKVPSCVAIPGGHASPRTPTPTPTPR
jgi:hypothetical protein